MLINLWLSHWYFSSLSTSYFLLLWRCMCFLFFVVGERGGWKLQPYATQGWSHVWVLQGVMQLGRWVKNLKICVLYFWTAPYLNKLWSYVLALLFLSEFHKWWKIMKNLRKWFELEQGDQSLFGDHSKKMLIFTISCTLLVGIFESKNFFSHWRNFIFAKS